MLIATVSSLTFRLTLFVVVRLHWLQHTLPMRMQVTCAGVERKNVSHFNFHPSDAEPVRGNTEIVSSSLSSDFYDTVDAFYILVKFSIQITQFS